MASSREGVIAFPSTRQEPPSLAHVGGKGLSLWRMSSVPGISVPNGFVLTTTFFELWFAALSNMPCWAEMLAACEAYDPDDQQKIASLHACCEATKAASKELPLSDAQRAEITRSIEAMAGQGSVSFVAVRSSSPEEDLAGMSFAGGYETVLGVKTAVEAVEQAVQHVFASCLDERVFIYKRTHGIRDLTPRIAVVVQRQVAASVAGVAFSLDPISNCYDWAMINSNFGLGESVVSGQCSPDYYLTNKVTSTMLKKEVGKKETAVWLGNDGGVHEKPGPSGEFSLSDSEVATLTKQLLELERFYGHPIDTEFALDESRHLLWLQARPITTHMTLHRSMTTKPGAPEVLWIDIMQIVQGFSDKLRPAGLSGVQFILSEAFMSTFLGFNHNHANQRNRPFFAAPESGVLYVNASYIIRHLGWNRKEAWADKLELVDFGTAKVIRELEDNSFLSSVDLSPLPLYLLWNMPGLPLNVRSSGRDLKRQAERAKDAHAGLWNMACDLFKLRGFESLAAKRGAWQDRDAPSGVSGCSCCMGNIYFPPTKQLVQDYRRQQGYAEDVELHVLDLLRAVKKTLAKNLGYGLMPTVISGGLAIKNINAAFEKAPQETKALLDDVTCGCGFVTTELSDLLEDLAVALEAAGGYDLETLRAGVAAGGVGLPAEAWQVWQLILEQFGHRGVGELDLSQPRYREQPELLLQQVISVMGLDRSMRPKQMTEKARAKRDAAVQTLSQWLSTNGGDAADFRKQVDRYHMHFCHRESPKYLMIKFLELAHMEVKKQALLLVKAGELDSAEDVWMLTLQDLWELHHNPSLSARQRYNDNLATWTKNNHVKNWPKVVTSRGREMRPKPREAKEGEVGGHAVAPGVARGRIKVLHNPTEKPLLTGEILVAKATDPGWTPLFVPAAAVLLEVGGALQHGALVAREFGKPCVAGIDGVTEKFTDGQLVEVNGTEGIVKILDEAA